MGPRQCAAVRECVSFQGPKVGLKHFVAVGVCPNQGPTVGLGSALQRMFVFSAPCGGAQAVCWGGVLLWVFVLSGLEARAPSLAAHTPPGTKLIRKHISRNALNENKACLKLRECRWTT